MCRATIQSRHSAFAPASAPQCRNRSIPGLPNTPRHRRENPLQAARQGSFARQRNQATGAIQGLLPHPPGRGLRPPPGSALRRHEPQTRHKTYKPKNIKMLCHEPPRSIKGKMQEGINKRMILCYAFSITRRSYDNMS